MLQRKIGEDDGGENSPAGMNPDFETSPGEDAGVDAGVDAGENPSAGEGAGENPGEANGDVSAEDVWENPGEQGPPGLIPDSSCCGTGLGDENWS